MGEVEVKLTRMVDFIEFAFAGDEVKVVRGNAGEVEGVWIGGRPVKLGD